LGDATVSSDRQLTRRARAISVAVLSAIVWLASPRAKADEDIPTYKALRCERDCPPFTEAKEVTVVAPIYPSQYTGGEGVYVEALVDVDFTIAVDGSVKNPFVEFLLGPQAFADSALHAISLRTYQPGTENGLPIAENHRTRFVFSISNPLVGAREEVATSYHRAIELADTGKIADAIAVLNEATAKPLLNFYERTMLAYALAKLYSSTGDYWYARVAVRVATIFEAHYYLDKRVIDTAIRLRITLEALNGDFAESFAWFDILNKRAQVKDDDPISLYIKKLHAAIDSSSPLIMDARISVASGPAKGVDDPLSWQHTLLRREFEFSQVDGKLDHFDLLCDRHAIRSPVSDKAHWTVPASWTGCVINVFGAPNTKFRFVEMPSAVH